MTNAKICDTILGWRAGYPQRGQMSRRCAADSLRFDTALLTSHEDWHHIGTALLGAYALRFHFDTALHGAVYIHISLKDGQGVSLKINCRKKVRGWDFLHLLKIPCPRKIQSENFLLLLRVPNRDCPKLSHFEKIP